MLRRGAGLPRRLLSTVATTSAEEAPKKRSKFFIAGVTILGASGTSTAALFYTVDCYTNDAGFRAWLRKDLAAVAKKLEDVMVDYFPKSSHAVRLEDDLAADDSGSREVFQVAKEIARSSNEPNAAHSNVTSAFNLGAAPQVLGAATRVLGAAPQVLGAATRVLGAVAQVLGAATQALGAVAQVLGPATRARNCV